MHKMHTLSKFVGLLLLFVMLVAPVAGVRANATPVPETDGLQPTAILVTMASVPMRVAGSDGMDHIEYDLLVTNTFAAPVTLTSLDILDQDGAVLTTLEGDALSAVTQDLLQPLSLNPIPANGTAALVLGASVPPDQPVTEVSHRISYEVAPDAPARSVLGSFEINGPTMAVSPQAPIVVNPPLRGEGWLNANGCCDPLTLHRSIRLTAGGLAIAKSETFAIDWIRWQDNSIFTGDGSRNEDWHAYGAELLAAADGTVVATRDDMPDELPFHAPEHLFGPGDYPGNHVILEIGPGVYAFYAHMLPGSVAVEVGDTVRAGDVLGLLGNSGSTSGPHLHFGLLDLPDPLLGNSLPMAFSSYTLAGTVNSADFATMDSDPSDANIPLTGPAVEQTDTLQLVWTVADFD